MRAAVLSAGKIVVREDVAEPTPGLFQALVEVKACGICGSDLHFARHGARMLELGQQMEGGTALGGSAPEPLDLDRDVYLGHEFAAEVLDYGPGTDPTVPVGSLVTSLPILLGAPPADAPDQPVVDPIVYSNRVHGGYAERMLLTAPALLAIPNGLPAHHAALTEPMAVGLHAVNRSGIARGDGALVLGCGPVGLAVIAALEVKGVGPIVAADLSSTRRGLAAAMGAHEVVDPAQESPWTAWSRRSVAAGPVVFEAIGVPGIIDGILRSAPAHSRVVVVGVCMETDRINPFFGISKELSVQFVLGYDPEEFARSLRSIAEGEIDVAPLVTARVALDEVPWAFEALGDPEEHCKIVVEP